MSELKSARGSPAFKLAVARFSAMHAANPNDLSVLLGLARNLRYSGDAPAALAVLNDGEKQFAKASNYQTELGKARLTNGDVKGAQNSLEAATAADSRNWHAFAALGVVYDLMRTFDKAKIAYSQALKACSSSVSLRNNMAISAGLSGDPQKALAILRKLHSEVPSEPTVAGNIERFEQIQKDCTTCTSKDYQKIASSIYAPGAGAISDNLSCDAPMPQTDPIVQAIEEKNFVDVHIQFKFDSAVLTARSLPVLADVAAAIIGPNLGGYRFTLEGHTDARGSDAYNQALSELRAGAVKRYLVDKLGVSTERLDTIGYGEQRLLDATAPEAATNRRVRITRLGKSD